MLTCSWSRPSDSTDRRHSEQLGAGLKEAVWQVNDVVAGDEDVGQRKERVDQRGLTCFRRLWRVHAGRTVALADADTRRDRGSTPLARIEAVEGLTPGVHPGYWQIRDTPDCS